MNEEDYCQKSQDCTRFTEGIKKLMCCFTLNVINYFLFFYLLYFVVVALLLLHMTLLSVSITAAVSD